MAGLEVDGGQDEGGESEGAEAERSRVGELAALDRAVETGLELTTEGGKTALSSGGIGVNVSERVTTVVVTRLGGRIGAVVVTGSRAHVLLAGRMVGRRRRRRHCEI